MVVKSYLSQLINEAEFVRTQLFGMTDGHQASGITSFSAGSPSAEGHQGISPDLMARVNSLEYQLKEKESLVVNINIEKSKLLDEVEKMKKNPGAAAAAGSGNQEELTQKIKNLEDRLEEYALFEEDLANLKRLQQENTQLKKKLGDIGGGSPETTFNIPAGKKEAPTERKILAAVPDIEPEIEAPAPKPAAKKHALDPEAIESLLNGTPATPPEAPEAAEIPALQARADDPTPSFDDIEPVEPSFDEPEKSSPTSDQFEKLVDSVEDSLEAPAPAPKPAPIAAAAPAPTPMAAPQKAAAAPVAAAAPAAPDTLANKTDEELLKEFENLLNS